jgi:hypothetical protein
MRWAGPRCTYRTGEKSWQGYSQKTWMERPRLIKQPFDVILCTVNSISALMTDIWVTTPCRIINVSQHASFIFRVTDLQSGGCWSNWEKENNNTMHIQRYTVAHSCYHSCHGNAIRSVFIVVGVDVGVNSIKVFSGTTEMQQWVPFALLSSYKIFHIAVNSNKY